MGFAKTPIFDVLTQNNIYFCCGPFKNVQTNFPFKWFSDFREMYVLNIFPFDPTFKLCPGFPIHIKTRGIYL
jgi:hypothetical protein